MFAGFVKWVLTVVMAFALGVGYGGADPKPEDSELKQKVQDHMDVIVDEAAGIVDDVLDEARKDEHVQEAEEFIDDVNEIIDNTVDDIHKHFDKDETEEAGEEQAEAPGAEEEVKEAEEAAGDADQAEEPVAEEGESAGADETKPAEE